MPVLTAFENVELPLLLASLSRRERRERVCIVLSLVGLTDRPTTIRMSYPGAAANASRLPRAHYDPRLSSRTSDWRSRSHHAEEILGLLDRSIRTGQDRADGNSRPQGRGEGTTRSDLEKGVLVD